MQALPHCSLNIHYDTYKENLTKNREFLQLRMPIISFILMIFMFDSEMILLAEIKLWSVEGERVKLTKVAWNFFDMFWNDDRKTVRVSLMSI